MAGVPIGTKHGGLAGFNTVDGYLESMFRGFRIDILKPEDYQAMTQQSETLDGAPEDPKPSPVTSSPPAHARAPSLAAAARRASLPLRCPRELAAARRPVSWALDPPLCEPSDPPRAV